MSVSLILTLCSYLSFQSWPVRTYSSQCWSAQHCRFRTGRRTIPWTPRRTSLLGLSSEDEADSLESTPGVARCGSGSHAPVSSESSPVADADEVLVKKRALKWVKQQVSALLHGEDLPEGTQAREVAEVPYQIPAVPSEGKDCPVCQQSFKTTTA